LIEREDSCTSDTLIPCLSCWCFVLFSMLCSVLDLPVFFFFW